MVEGKEGRVRKEGKKGREGECRGGGKGKGGRDKVENRGVKGES